MKLKELIRAGRVFDRQEGRAGFYHIALDIANKYLLQAAIIILATWNGSRFRMKSNDPKNLIKLEATIKLIKPLLSPLKAYNIQRVDLKRKAPEIIKIYNLLSRIPGVEYTGASKVMNIANPKLFVMWDSYIRKHYEIKGNDGKAYVRFLEKMQKEVKNIRWDKRSKTLAKAIDEYNYVYYTLPELKKDRINKKNKKY